MATKKGPGKTARPEQAEQSEPAATAARVHQPIAANSLDVFSSRPAALQAASAAKASGGDSITAARDLTASERRMAERLAPSQDADHSDEPGSTGATREQIEAMGAASGVSRQSAREPMAAEQEQKRQQLEDLNNGVERDGPDLGDFRRGALEADLGLKSAAEVSNDTALGLGVTTGAIQSGLAHGSAKDYLSAADGDPLTEAIAAALKEHPNSGIAGPTGTSTPTATPAPGATGAAPANGSTTSGGVGYNDHVTVDEDGNLLAPKTTTNWRQEYPTLAKIADVFTGEVTPAGETPKGEQLRLADDELSPKTTAPPANTGEPAVTPPTPATDQSQDSDAGISPTQPKPDAVDPEAILRWQAYLHANGMGPRDKSGDTVNPSPEAAGAGSRMPVTGLRAESKQDLVGQPGREGTTSYNGDGLPTYNGRAGATDPPDDTVSEPTPGPEDDEEVNTDPNHNNLEHLAPGADAENDDSGFAKRYASFRATRATDDDDD